MSMPGDGSLIRQRTGHEFLKDVLITQETKQNAKL
jgi:hypothetical protein